jgi:integrase
MAGERGSYRKSGYYKLPDGTEIVGLKRRPDGRFYAAKQPGKTFGTDPSQAVFRFRQWADEHAIDGQIVANIIQGRNIPLPDNADGAPAYVDRLWENAREFDELLERKWRQANALRIRQWILDDPRGFVQATGTHDIVSFGRMAPSPTLESLGKLYAEKSGATDEWVEKTDTFWQEFMKAVAVSTVRELTPEAITAYYDEINEADKSPTWKGHRFGAIKTVFAFARKRGVSPDEVSKVLGYCAILVKPKKNGANPRPITPDDFNAIYDKANERLKTGMMCALNFAMYAKEVCAVEWADLSLEKGTLVTDRAKTGQTRIAVLWPGTVDLLKELPRTGPYVFMSEHGGALAPNTLRRDWWDARKKAGVDQDVVFSMIRDGAYSAAVEGGADLTHAKLLAGHAIGGMSDYYVRRNPRMVADACAAIERHYFPPKPEGNNAKPTPQ